MRKVTKEEFLKIYNLNKLPIVLYGAGTVGEHVLEWFKEREIIPYCFADSSVEKVGNTLNNLTIISAKNLKDINFKRYIIIITVAEDKVKEINDILLANELKENVYYMKGADEVNTVDEFYKWLKTVPWHLKSCYDNIENFSNEYIEGLVDAQPRVYLDGKQMKLASYSKSGVEFHNNMRRTFYNPKSYDNIIYFFGDSRVVGYLNEDQYTIESFLQQKILESLSKQYLIINKGIFLDYTNIFWEMIKSEKYRKGDIVILGLSPRLYEEGSKRLNVSRKRLTEIFIHYLKKINDYLKSNEVEFYFAIMPCVSDVEKPSAVEYYLQKEVFPNHKKVLNLDDKYLIQLANISRIRLIDLRKAVQRPHVYGDFFVDHSHYGPKGNELLAESILETLKMSEIIERIDTNIEDLQKEYENICYSKKIDNLKEYDLNKYLEELKKIGTNKSKWNGSIVMNCNPFTKGHRYIIEKAAAQVDKLYIFIVEEDKSIFPFQIRKELVEKGVKDLKNVEVLSSGKYIISLETFPEYFSKDLLQETSVDSSKDLILFGEKIAPILEIKKRFVGTEPNCRVTNQYNQQMKEILPQYGVEIIEMNRCKEGEKVISASVVRKLIKEGNFDEIKALVPVSTYEYIMENIQIVTDFIHNSHDKID